MSTAIEEKEPSGPSDHWMKTVVSAIPEMGAEEPKPVELPPDKIETKTDVPTKPDAAPPKPGAAAPAPKPDDEHEEAFPRNAEQWKAFKAKRKAREEELTKQLGEREARIKEIEAKVSTGPTPEEKAEVERLRKENEEYSERLRLLDVERHPKFQAHFTNRKQEAMGMVKHIVGADRAAEFEQVLNMPASEYRTAKLDEMVADLSVMQQSRLGGAINTLEAIEAERQAEIAKSKDNFTAMQAQTKAQKEAQKAAAEKLFDSTAAAMMKDNPAFQKREGNAEWNAQVDKNIAAAKALVFEKASPEQVMRTALHAQAVAPLLQQVSGLMEENAKLQAQVKALSSANPGMQPGSKPSGDSQPIKSFSTPADGIKSWMESIGPLPGSQ